MQNKYSDALNVYQESLSIRETCLPPNHPHLSYSYANIGDTQVDLNNNDLALKHYYQALSIFTRSLPSKHPQIAGVLRRIGTVLL